MKKLYSVFSLLLLTLLSFSASATRTVQVNCNFVDYLEVREGGADGTIIPVEVSPTEFTTDATELYFAVKQPDEMTFTYLTYTGADGSISSVRDVASPVVLTDEMMAKGQVTVNVTIARKNFIKLNVPDPSLIRVKAGSNSTEAFPLTEGLNKIALEQYGGFYVELTDPENYRLTKFYRVSDNKPYGIELYRSLSVYSYQFEAGDEFSYEVVRAEDFQAPSVYVTVDNPEAVNISIAYQELKGFEPGVRTKVELTESPCNFSVSSSDAIYRITLNEETLTSYSDSYYNFSVSDGDEIVITSEFPEVYSTITLSVEPAENADAISRVVLAGQYLTDWSEPFQGKAGKKLLVGLNTNLFNIESVTVNGVDQGRIYTDFEVKVGEEDMNIVVKANKYQTYNATLVVDDPANVNVSINSFDFNLSEGENPIEFTENANYIRIVGAEGAVLDKVVTVVGDSEREVEIYSNQTSVSLEDGMKIVLTTHKLTIDKKVVFYSTHDTEDAAFGYVSFYVAGSYSSIPFSKGYSVKEFNELQGNFRFSASDASYYDVDPMHVYLNGEELENGGYYGYNFDLKDNDVIKFYFFTDPAQYKATFDIAEDCEVEVVKDLYTAVEPAAGVSDYEGTLIQLTNKGTEAVTVTVDGAAVEAEDGVYNVVLDADKEIKVIPAGTTGIENVASGADAENNVYTVSGVLVLRNATAEQINALPAGIYVSAGRKIVVR